MSSARYKLKTGQINFESLDNPGAYACVVIKNGVFHNLSDPLRQILIKALQQPSSSQPSAASVEVTPSRAATTDLEDMF